MTFLIWTGKSHPSLDDVISTVVVDIKTLYELIMETSLDTIKVFDLHHEDAVIDGKCIFKNPKIQKRSESADWVKRLCDFAITRQPSSYVTFANKLLQFGNYNLLLRFGICEGIFIDDHPHFSYQLYNLYRHYDVYSCASTHVRLYRAFKNLMNGDGRIFALAVLEQALVNEGYSGIKDIVETVRGLRELNLPREIILIITGYDDLTDGLC